MNINLFRNEGFTDLDSTDFADSVMQDSEVQDNKRKNGTKDSAESPAKSMRTDITTYAVEPWVYKPWDVDEWTFEKQELASKALCVFLNSRFLCIGKDRWSMSRVTKGLSLHTDDLLKQIFDLFKLNKLSSLPAGELDKGYQIALGRSFVNLDFDNKKVSYIPQDLTLMEVAKFFHAQSIARSDLNIFRLAIDSYIAAANSGSLEAFNILDKDYFLDGFKYHSNMHIKVCQTLGNIYTEKGNFQEAKKRYDFAWDVFDKAVCRGDYKVQQFYNHGIGGKTAEEVNAFMIKVLDGHIQSRRSSWLVLLFEKSNLCEAYEKKRKLVTLTLNQIQDFYSFFCHSDRYSTKTKALFKILNTIVECQPPIKLIFCEGSIYSKDSLTHTIHPKKPEDYERFWKCFGKFDKLFTFTEELIPCLKITKDNYKYFQQLLSLHPDFPDTKESDSQR